MYNCPSLAFYKDKVTGAIVHEVDKCIGCKYCTWACPYDSPKFNPGTGLIEKCTFCMERIEEGLKPACANLCPVGALDFKREEFSGEEAFKSSPVPIDVGSSLKVIKLRKTGAPKMDRSLQQEIKIPAPRASKSEKITPSKEWPLISFSLLSAWMVALFLTRQQVGNPVWLKWALPAMGIIATVLSFSHLGKKLNSWRAILNVERSWLSREIFFFAFFFIGLIVDFFVYDLPEAVMIINGIFFLVSVDRLYMLATWKWKVKVHSAQVIFIVASIWLLVSGYELFFILFTILRGGLFALQKGARGSISSVHSASGFFMIFLPVVIISMVVYQVNYMVILALVLLTDVLDRVEFYGDLKVAEPGEEIGRE
jgi:DMSO reductase anchor subunit/ferredoxin